MGRVSERIDRLEVVFDDESLVADGGLLAAGTLFDRLGLEELWDEMLRLGGRVGGANPGRKVLSLVSSMLVGGTHIDHADRLRAGATAGVLPHRVMAPSTLGTFLRSFGRDDIGLLDEALEETLRRVWAAGAGPGGGPVTIDVDSTVCEVCGKAKEGAGFWTRRGVELPPAVGDTRRDRRDNCGPPCAKAAPSGATSVSWPRPWAVSAGPGPGGGSPYAPIRDSIPTTWWRR